MISQELIKLKWKEFKNGVKNQWGSLNDEDLDKTNGSVPAIQELIMKRYNESYEGMNFKMSQLLDSFDNETDRSSNTKGISSFQRSPIVNEAYNPQVKISSTESDAPATSPDYTKKLSKAKAVEKYRYINDDRSKVNSNRKNLPDRELNSIKESAH